MMVMTPEEISEQLKYMGETGEFLNSLVVMERLQGKSIRVYCNTQNFCFMRDVSENAIDRVLIDVLIYSKEFVVSFYIDEYYNTTLLLSVMIFAQKFPEKVKYNKNSGRFYNIKFKIKDLDELKDLLQNTFLKSSIRW